jgi:GNAT superfamily N-acetyltransferase
MEEIMEITYKQLSEGEWEGAHSRIYRAIIQKHGLLVVLRDDNGTIIGATLPDGTIVRLGELNGTNMERRGLALMVDPNYEGRGIGGRLGKLLIDHAIGAQIPRIDTTCVTGSSCSKILLKNGFVGYDPYTGRLDDQGYNGRINMKWVNPSLAKGRIE